MRPSALEPTRPRQPTEPGYRAGQKPPNFGKTYPPEPLTPGELMRLLAACPRKGPRGPRNRALIVMLWRAGLRIAEATALLPRDVDLVHGVVTVRRGKGAKRRVVGLDPQAAAVVERWVEARTELGVNGTSPLFCTVVAPRLGGPMRPNNFNGQLAKIARRAGIDKRVHPHGLRHTHAFELIMEGTPLNLIKAQLGHSRLATTERYTNHLAPAQLIEAMQGRAWPEAAIALPTKSQDTVRGALERAAAVLVEAA